MRTFYTAFVPFLLLAISRLSHAQDCDIVSEQACCYVEADNGGDTSYCCNGSIVGNTSGSGAAIFNDLTCCQNDGRTAINVGFDITTCRAGSATPLTAKGTAASSVADVIKSISASRSASRESLYASASASRASAAGATATSTGGSTTRASSQSTASLSSSGVTSSASGASSSASSAVGAITSSGAGAVTSSGSAAAASASTSATSTGGAAMMTMDAWNAVMAGGLLVAAVAL